MQEGRSNSFLVILLAIIVAVLSLYFYYNGFPNLNLNFLKTSTNSQNNTSTTKPQISPEDGLKYLSSITQADFPHIAKSAEISSTKLPNEVASLLSKENVSLKVNSVTFSGGKTGYEIKFTLPENVVTVYKSLSKSFDYKIWHMISGAFSEDSASLVLDSKSYQVKTQFIVGVNSATKVDMVVISK